ncbi:MAG: hypothetical protein M3P43_06655 [Actinomycetota bacterium]|nr:hypothetical protein [Actinomycetota bacterium]
MTAPRGTDAASASSLSPLLARTFEAFDAAGVRWCLLRGERQLGDVEGDIDVLVPPADWARLRRLSVRHGFVPIRTWGRGSHRFLVGYDPIADAWLRLDVVRDLRFGPYQSLKLAQRAEDLRRRRSGNVFVLDDGDAFWTLLLHCLLDKTEIAPKHRSRLCELAEHGAGSDGLGALVDRVVASVSITADDLLRTAKRGDWETLEALRPVLRSCFVRSQPVRAAARRTVNAILRRATRVVLLGERGLTVALTGPDGAGKSTLAAALRRHLPFPVAAVYMGMHRDAEGSARGERPRALPVRLIRQWVRYAKARFLRARGFLVIFDRYSVDATFPAAGHPSPVRRALRWLIGHGGPAPDLTLVLDAPAEVLFERKHEQPVDVLERRRRQYLELAERHPRTLVVDSTLDIEQVRRDVTSAIWNEYVRRSGGAGASSTAS